MRLSELRLFPLRYRPRSTNWLFPSKSVPCSFYYNVKREAKTKFQGSKWFTITIQDFFLIAPRGCNRFRTSFYVMIQTCDLSFCFTNKAQLKIGHFFFKKLIKGGIILFERSNKVPFYGSKHKSDLAQFGSSLFSKDIFKLQSQFPQNYI